MCIEGHHLASWQEQFARAERQQDLVAAARTEDGGRGRAWLVSPGAARRSGIMAADEEPSPGGGREEEEEAVSVTAEACAKSGGGEGPAGCVWGRESGCGPRGGARRPLRRVARLWPLGARSQGAVGLRPDGHAVLRMADGEAVALGNVA